MVSSTSTKRYSITTIREEVIHLIQVGVVALNQPLRILCEYLIFACTTVECNRM